MLELEDIRNTWTPVVGLVRKSSGEKSTDQRDSIPAQIHKIKRFINDYRLKLEEKQIVGRYKDDEGNEVIERGFSIREGSGLDIERSDIDDIVLSVRAGGTKNIVIDDFSRLMRADTRNASKKLDFLSEVDIGIIIVEEGPRIFRPDLASHFQELTRMAEEAHKYSARTSRNTIRAIAYRADNMLMPIKEGFGYRVHSVKTRKVVDSWSVEGVDAELEIIKETIHKYISGEKKILICKWFKEKTGRRISQQNLERLVTDKKWMGVYERFKVKSGKIHSVGRNGTAVEYQRFKSKHDRSRPYKSIIEPQDSSVTIAIPLSQQNIDVGMGSIRIITEDEHQKVIERFNNKDKRNRVEQIIHPFGGLVHCSDCGYKMKSQKRNKDRTVQYACGEYQTERELCKVRKAIKEEVLGYCVMESYLHSIMVSADKVIDGLDERRNLIAATPLYLDLKRKKDNWDVHRRKLIGDGKIDSMDYREAVDEIAKINKEMEREENRKVNVIVGGDEKWTLGRLLNVDEPSTEDVIKEGRALYREYIENPFVPDVDLVRAIVRRIDVGFQMKDMKYGTTGRKKAVPTTLKIDFNTGFNLTVAIADCLGAIL